MRIKAMVCFLALAALAAPTSANACDFKKMFGGGFGGFGCHKPAPPPCYPPVTYSYPVMAAPVATLSAGAAGTDFISFPSAPAMAPASFSAPSFSAPSFAPAYAAPQGGYPAPQGPIYGSPQH